MRTPKVVIPDNHHRVIVRRCAGYECVRPITTHRVRQNVNGHREYCSLLCYSRWSPEMRTVITRFRDYDQSPSGLEILIMNLKYDQGVTGAANTLGISRSTVSYWLRKLMLFRQFAGQPPEAILAMLSEVAEGKGIQEAAKLVEMNPKTLQRAFDEFKPLRMAA